MSNESGEWKSKLLSTGVPLEIDVSRTLSDLGFSVFPDFSYERDSTSGDCSVDLLVTKSICHPNQLLPIEIYLLVECKYRSPNRRMLFFPHHGNSWHPRPLEILDRLSSEHLGKQSIMDFIDGIPRAAKGLDVESAKSAKISDEEIRDGIRQLQFGMANLLKELCEDSLENRQNSDFIKRYAFNQRPRAGMSNIWGAAFVGLLLTPGDPNSWSSTRLKLFLWVLRRMARSLPPLEPRLVRPFIFGSVLVTNSEIWLAKESVTLSDVRCGDDIEAYSSRTTRVVVPGPSGPALKRIYRKLFDGFSSKYSSRLSELDELWSGREAWRASHKIRKMETEGHRADIIICNYESLRALMNDIESVAISSAAASSAMNVETQKKIWRKGSEPSIRDLLSKLKGASIDLTKALAGSKAEKDAE